MIVSKNFEKALNIFFAALLCLSVSDSFATEDSDRTLITVTQVTSASVAPTVPAAGTVFSRNETQITAGMAGRLLYLAEPGDFVAAGAAVAEFDCEMLELQKERQLAEAGPNHMRAKVPSRSTNTCLSAPAT